MSDKLQITTEVTPEIDDWLKDKGFSVIQLNGSQKPTQKWSRLSVNERSAAIREAKGNVEAAKAKFA